MNEERFKFRVYNKKSQSWVHGPGEEVNLFGEMIMLGGFMQSVSIQDYDKCEILQYTGLKDDDGVEIFEGDIIKDTWKENEPYGHFPDRENDREQVFAVKFKDYFFNVRPKRSGSQTLVEGVRRKVIGNIFDNPELLP